MATLRFENLAFEEITEEIQGGTNKGSKTVSPQIVRVTILKLFFFDILRTELEAIAGGGRADSTASFRLKIAENSLEFGGISEKQASSRFNHLLSRGLEQLKNRLTGAPAVY